MNYPYLEALTSADRRLMLGVLVRAIEKGKADGKPTGIKESIVKRLEAIESKAKP